MLRVKRLTVANTWTYKNAKFILAINSFKESYLNHLVRVFRYFSEKVVDLFGLDAAQKVLDP